MAYQMKIPVGMIFRKMYCRHCGTKLKRHKITKELYPTDSEFKRVVSGRINICKQTKVSYIYKCPSCEKTSTYNEQLYISKVQKRLGKKILSDDEIKTELP